MGDAFLAGEEPARGVAKDYPDIAFAFGSESVLENIIVGPDSGKGILLDLDSAKRALLRLQRKFGFRLLHPHFPPFLKGCARPRKRMNTCFFGRQYTEKAVGCQFQMTARMRDGRVATGKRVSTSGILGYKVCIQQRLCTLFQMGLAGGTRPMSRKRYVEDASVASRLHNQKSL